VLSRRHGRAAIPADSMDVRPSGAVENAGKLQRFGRGLLSAQSVRANEVPDAFFIGPDAFLCNV
jgi:hypothetical protein